MSQFNRFITIGVLNTFIGYGLFVLFLREFLLSAALSNFLSYSIIIIFSYFIYGKFVFGNKKTKPFSSLLYLISFLFALSCNQIVLNIFLRMTPFPPEICQIFGLITYTIIFYYLNKKYVY